MSTPNGAAGLIGGAWDGSARVGQSIGATVGGTSVCAATRLGVRSLLRRQLDSCCANGDKDGPQQAGRGGRRAGRDGDRLRPLGPGSGASLSGELDAQGGGEPGP